MLALYNRRIVLPITLLLTLLSFTTWGETETTSVLNRFVGKFSVTSIVTDKEGNTTTILSTMNNTLVNEHYIFSVLITQNPNETTHQLTRLGILEFDPQSNQYKNIWIGNSLNNCMSSDKQNYSLYEGEATDNQLTLYSYNGPDKSKWRRKNVVHFHDDGNFTAIITAPVNGGDERTLITGEFKRITE